MERIEKILRVALRIADSHAICCLTVMKNVIEKALAVVAFISILTIDTIACNRTVDSLDFKACRWEIQTPHDGIVLKTVGCTLYGRPQQLAVLEVDLNKYKVRFSQPSVRETTSGQAREMRAVAAVNAGFFLIPDVAPENFLKVGGKIISKKTIRTLLTNGAVVSEGLKPRIVRWNDEDSLTIVKSCSDVLVSNGLLVYESELCPIPWPGSYAHKLHPRTAVGITEDDKLLLVAVDGRFEGKDHGMTMAEVGLLMKFLGAKYALNLDGGGSTTLWVKGVGVVNYPCENKIWDHGGERKVGSILYLQSFQMESH